MSSNDLTSNNYCMEFTYKSNESFEINDGEYILVISEKDIDIEINKRSFDVNNNAIKIPITCKTFNIGNITVNITELTIKFTGADKIALINPNKRKNTLQLSTNNIIKKVHCNQISNDQISNEQILNNQFIPINILSQEKNNINIFNIFSNIIRSFKKSEGNIINGIKIIKIGKNIKNNYYITYIIIFDDEITTIFIDWVHISEEGNSIIAKEMAKDVESYLKEK